MAVMVSPARFTDKTDKEVALYFITWDNALDPNEFIIQVDWSSEPNGLTFTDSLIVGQTTQVRIGSGIPGQTYRVRCRVTLAQSQEVIEAGVNDQPGIPLQVLGPPHERLEAYRVW